MTFDVTDEWKLSEFIPHRIFRDIVVEMILAHPKLTHLECTMH